MKKRIWIIYEGKYYHDGTYVHSLHATKACAEKQCRADGFKSKDQLFENDKEQLYRQIEVENLDCDCWEPRKVKEGK